MKKVAGFDIDDVLLHLNTLLIEFGNQYFNTDFEYEDITTYQLWNIFPGTKEEIINMVKEIYASKEFEVLPADKGVEEVVRHSFEAFDEVYAITSRPDYIKNITLNNLELRFPGRFNEKNLIMTNQFLGSKTLSKAEICRNKGVNTMFEDCFEYADSIAELNHGMKVYLIDKPYNRIDTNKKNIIRINNWEEYMDKHSI